MSDEDIEDVLRLRPPIDRFRSSRTLSVTDVASQAWCEMQTGANSCGYLGGSPFSTSRQRSVWSIGAYERPR